MYPNRSLFGDFMIVELNGFVCHGNIGSKARSLVDLHRNGFKVPTSIALDTKEYFNVIKNIKSKINALLNRLNFDNIEIISKQIKMLFENVAFDDNIKDELLKVLHDDRYILRCSVDGVDESFSYAGLFPKKMGITKDNIFENIIDCYISLFSYNSLCYMLKNEIDYSNISTAIIIQREIKTNILGYVSVINPVTLDSNEMTIILNRDNENEIIYYNKNESKIINKLSCKILGEDRINETIELSKKIQSNLGYPIEIELAYSKNHIYVIQTKEIHGMLYENKDEIWKKKTMSSKEFMYSLVATSYNNVINSFCTDLDISISNNNVVQIFDGCYYNINCISNLIDKLYYFDQEYFNNYFKLEFGIKKNNSIFKRVKRFKYRNYLDNRISFFENNIEQLKEEYHIKYNKYCNEMGIVNANNIEDKWTKLVFEDYNSLYEKYLELKLLVLFEKNRLFKKLKQYITVKEFDELIIIKEKTSNYKILEIYNGLINKIKNDEDSYKYWFSSSTLKILKDFNENKKEYCHSDFKHFIDNYGYLSFFKFDLSESFYVEDVEDVIRDIKKQLANSHAVDDNEEDRKNILKKISDSMISKGYNESFLKIKRLQKLLIELFELKNYVLKFNFIVKRYSKMLSKLYYKRKILNSESDIWFLDIDSIYSYIEGDIDGELLSKKMSNNKLKYNSYRNYSSENTIGYYHENFGKYDFKGIGLTTDIVVGRVRMIKSLKDLDSLENTDIFVTKTINNNLLFLLPRIRGIIISDNYISNSTKTILRELKIPCIILENSSKKLVDNVWIKMDGFNGYIKKMKYNRNDK